MTKVIETFPDGTINEREATTAELKQLKIDQDYVAKIEADKAKTIEAKTALLKKLGITAEEADLLLS